MTADDLIDRIKALDPQGRAKVLELLLEIDGADKSADMDDKSFDRAADSVLKRHPELLRKLGSMSEPRFLTVEQVQRLH